MIGFAAEKLMELKVGAKTGAADGEKNASRLRRRRAGPIAPQVKQFSSSDAMQDEQMSKIKFLFLYATLAQTKRSMN